MLKARTGPWLAAALLASCKPVSADRPIEKVGVHDLNQQLRAEPPNVVTKDGKPGGVLDVLVTIDTEGRVIDAQVAGDNVWGVDPASGLAAARQWTFWPQSFDGRPVQAVGLIHVAYMRPEIPADTSVPFPEAPPGDVEIALEHSPCLQECGEYRVSIRGDGRVRFTARNENLPGGETNHETSRLAVIWPGVHEARVDPRAVAALVDKFRDAHFFGLRSRYSARNDTDYPTHALTLRVGKQVKRVAHHDEWVEGMPFVVGDLIDAVEKLAGTERWAQGNADTVTQLKREGFDFASPAALVFVRLAMVKSTLSPEDGRRVSELIRGMVAEGLNLEQPMPGGPGGETRPVGVVLASFAADTGDERLFKAMTDRGYLARMSKGELSGAFSGGAGCSPTIARALVAAGADPVGRGGALHFLRYANTACASPDGTRQVEMVRTLLKLGVPLEGRDNSGWTLLMGLASPEIAQALLQAGAKVDAKASDGTTAASSAEDDRVAILLLRAGADPRASGPYGSVRELAQKRYWPATLAWLDAHGVR